MVEAALKFPNEFAEIFGFPLEVDDPRYSVSKGVNGGAKQFREYLDLVSPYVEDELQKEAKKLRTFNTQFVIAEWGALPKLGIWEEADYRLMIDAPREERNRRLFERPHHSRISKEEYANVGDIREEAVRDIIQGATGIDHRIYNAYDERLEKDIQALSRKIMEQSI